MGNLCDAHGYSQAVGVLRDRARILFEDEDNHVVIEHAALFTSGIVFGIPNVVLFIRMAMEGFLHGGKIDNHTRDTARSDHDIGPHCQFAFDRQ